MVKITSSCGNVFADLGLPNAARIVLEETQRMSVRWIAVNDLDAVIERIRFRHVAKPDMVLTFPEEQASIAPLEAVSTETPSEDRVEME